MTPSNKQIWRMLKNIVNFMEEELEFDHGYGGTIRMGGDSHKAIDRLQKQICDTETPPKTPAENEKNAVDEICHVLDSTLNQNMSHLCTQLELRQKLREIIGEYRLKEEEDGEKRQNFESE